jgi:hypothetical protein
MLIVALHFSISQRRLALVRTLLYSQELMKPQAKRYFQILVALALPFFILPSSAMGNDDIESLINQLPDVSKMGFGYSAQFSGSQFLPDSDSNEVHTLVLGSQAPANSDILEAIVKAGFRAVPFLLKHIDDARATKIPPMQGMMWIGYRDEYDFNSRTRTDIPKGVNRQDAGITTDHTVTVGDLCFVALGQIVNRGFNATRYQPTGGLIINSPTSSKALCDVVRMDFKDFTTEKHLGLLLEDFTQPDSEGRRVGAYLRLAFYYPEEVEAPVLKQLTVPSYDIFKIEPFVRQELYPEKSAEKRRKMLADFINKNGPASSDGIRSELFEDLDTQEADEQHNLHPPLQEKYDARNALIELYGYKPEVKSKDKPFRSTWEGCEEARFIDALGHTNSEKIDAAVHEIFLRAGDQDDYSLAIACMHRLVGKGYDKELAEYCRQHIGKGTSSDEEFKQVLKSINQNRKNTENGAK